MTMLARRGLPVTLAALSAISLSSVAAPAEFPEAEISNGLIHARLYLPDTQHGYYRSTRFDWSGVIPLLEYKGHNFFGQWFDRYDPKIHDAIQGPVEEYLSNGLALGYTEAKTGESFVKIGVGALRKPEEARYDHFKTYEIADNGKWSVKKAPDRVEFTQVLGDTGGYAYVYKKTVRLSRGKPELVLEHSLKNTGSKVIETSVYNHDFYMIDGQPTGPDYVVKFRFPVRAAGDLKGAAATRDNEFTYLKELPKGQSVYSELEGFGPSAADNDIRVENRKAGAGVREVGDRPIERIYFWSIRSTVCPEAYIHLRIDPGKEQTWKIAYEFYTLPASAQ